jgi:hypothetical protein
MKIYVVKLENYEFLKNKIKKYEVDFTKTGCG